MRPVVDVALAAVGSVAVLCVMRGAFRRWHLLAGARRHLAYVLRGQPHQPGLDDPHGPVTRVRLQGVGHVKVHQHRPVAGKVKTISVKREGRRWYVILTAEQEQPEPLLATASMVGIDLGIANFLADSGGEFVPNPRHAAKAAARLEVAQRALARCKRGSKRRRKAVETVARLHRKVRRQRLDHAHKTALNLVRDHDFIAHEDLRIRTMSKAPAPKPDPATPDSFLPNGAAAKTGQNRSIADAGWGVFLTILTAKAECAGREVMAVDSRNISRRCPVCGHTAQENRPAQEKFHCVSCGHQAHADTVGALNVLRAGLVRREAQPASREAPTFGWGRSHRGIQPVVQHVVRPVVDQLGRHRLVRLQLRHGRQPHCLLP
ncbi:transposase [Streptomyces sp. NBC_00841]|uniref:RNA-guided endonuclease InsQ/TnpB family protein n=1 Tax=Streptomyces sp. NBC_00841 TaxID=2975847 RepID=UPI002DDAB6A6|nr:transposase [Streptomyces sp. NBC_00841]WRZ96910.1 transposase [Streptomyces sp. NBC_00841]